MGYGLFSIYSTEEKQSLKKAEETQRAKYSVLQASIPSMIICIYSRVMKGS